MARPVGGGTAARYPGFTGEAALGRGGRAYRPLGGRRASATGILPAVSAVSSYYVGVVCNGGTLCVYTEDFDEDGNVVGWHCVDEVGSC
jgi:hypothetical protein